MCQICEKLDSMLECLEALHPANELREVLISRAANDKTISIVKDMSDGAIRVDFVMELLIHVTEKYNYDYFEIASEIVRRFGVRDRAHEESEID